MILRRIAEHVKAQNWLAVAIDFVIVVTGVFIGIQVANWNEARQDRKDERFYLTRLHDDILSAERLSSRQLQSRIDRLDVLASASDTLVGISDRTTLTAAECNALASSHVLMLALTELPALAELQSAGRLSVIRDSNTRTALIALQQAQYVLAKVIDKGDNGAVSLGNTFPSRLAVESYFDGEQGRRRMRAICDVAAMRDDQAFLNALSENTQRYDAYVRFYLQPWAAQFTTAHGNIDTALGFNHSMRDAP